MTHDVEIECLPKDLPHDITVDISALTIGDSIHVSDLPELEGVKFLTPKEHVICAIVAKAAEIVETEEEGEIEGEGLAADEAAASQNEAKDESKED